VENCLTNETKFTDITRTKCVAVCEPVDRTLKIY